MAKISAGSYEMNKWLYGGYDKDIVTVMYGGPGTGKTNFCLITAVSQAKKGNKVIFIDTEGGFSSERVKQIVGEDKEEFNKVLKNILLLKPTNFEEQKQAFQELLKNLKKEVSLIVVDGLTILYRLDFASARQDKTDENAYRKINAELAKQMRTLAEIARKQNIPVLATAQAYRWEEADRIVGGDIIKYWAKCIIELENEKGKRTAYLRKHRSIKESSFGFIIDGRGIRKKGWI